MTAPLSFLDARSLDRRLVGGKAANLAKLGQGGFPVPPGFTVTTSGYAAFIEANDLWSAIAAHLGRIDFDDAITVEAGASAIRDAIMAAVMPPDMAAEIRASYAELGGGDCYVAVRSSGTAEDLAEASFAGQHDTYLDIRGDALLDAVKRCWASLWTARSVAYRQRMGIDQEAVRLAVVVQEMIPSEVSGVMFTANPMTGAVDEYVVNSSWGLGEAIVSGIVTPDQFVVNRDDLSVADRVIGPKELRIVRNPVNGIGTIEEEVAPHDRSRSSLEDEALVRLTALGARIADLYDGYPQDIEWSYSRGEFYILQSRDVTGIDFAWEEDLDSFHQIPKDREAVWTRAWADAVWTGKISPLFFTIRSEVGQRVVAYTAKLWGFPDIARHRVFKYIRGFALYNSGVDYATFKHLLPPFLRRSAVMENVPPNLHDQLRKEPFSWWRFVRALIRIRLLDPVHDPLLYAKHNYATMLQKRDTSLGVGPAKLSYMTDRALKRYAEHCIAEEVEWVEDLWTPLVVYTPLAMSALAYMLEHWYGSEDPMLLSDMLIGLPAASITIDENHRMWKLSQRIKGSGPAAELFARYEGRSFFDALARDPSLKHVYAEYRSFMEDFGHRGHEDRDILFDRRREDPGLLYNSLRVLMDVTEPPEDKTALLIERREEATQAVLAVIRKRVFGGIKATVFQAVQAWTLKYFVHRDDQRDLSDRLVWAQKEAFLEVGRRLVDRGVLVRLEDVYLFGKLELFEMLDGVVQPRLVAAKARARQQALDEHRQQYVAPMYMVGDIATDLAPRAADSGGGALLGIGTSRGRVTATARVIRNQKDIWRVKKGDILITHATDPGWTPVFMVISGLVLETGGMLAHGSCISREYGIPAVQIGEAMSLIPDGANITIDGSTGTVEIHEVPVE